VSRRLHAAPRRGRASELRQRPRRAPVGKLGHRAQSRKHVALHLDQRDRAHSLAAIGMEHGVVAVFPALVGQAGFRSAGVIQKAIRVRVTNPFDPVDSGSQRGPQHVDQAHAPVRVA
jgi:hypothetical protein